MPASIHNATSALNVCVPVPAAHEPAADNIIAALAEALFSGEHYEIIDRGGELFVQPAAHRSRSTAAVFSPDARARREAIAMAA